MESNVLERDVEETLRKGVTKLKGMSIKFKSPGMAAIPDRLNLFPGSLISFVETKTLTGRVAKLQDVLHRMFARLGFPVEVVDTKEKVKVYLAKYKQLIEEQDL